MVNRTAPSFEDRVGQVLVEGGFITEQQLAQARQDSDTGLLDALVSQGMLAQETLITVLSFQLRIPVVDLRHVQVDPEAVRLVPEEYARQYSVMPTGFDTDGSLRIATRMPNDFQLSSELSSVTGRQTKFVLAIGGKLEDLIDKVYSSAPPPRPEPGPEGQAPLDAPMGTLAPINISATGAIFGQDLSQLPAVQAVDMVTLQAVKGHASDIHMVPSSDSSRVLFRLDGELKEMVVLPLTLHESMVSRIKVQAGMDISETRRPQDGSFSLMFGERKAEFRVSTVGTGWGEMMVIRVLDQSGNLLSLEALGLDSVALHVWRQLLALPYGMVLVSGPTGSGKTTTLYASVAELVNHRGNIMAVEDPIEYRLDGINQIQVNRAAGIDFPTGLRSIMRLDPDIILVGEIRDEETAKTAVNAALTGHLVLASIHSNDAASSIVRLLDLGVEPFLAATGVVGALAQRLVRVVDHSCQVLTEPSATEAMAYEQEMQQPTGEFWAGQGCNFCNGTGFSGRTGVFEVMAVDETMRKMISGGISGQELRTQALANGMISLRRAGMIKAQESATTLGEVVRKVFFID
ncbi:MAG: type II/IV secretion system protein [Chloroflexi bacterium]|nr:type II/IV secretion system protein [Chloroflexota bacterium]MCI0877988.1 type II/IV secretion system protein [Chloroflexota bacterium]MCI0893875.1 type II/IV secretion system protein [Chloroflexota bacterium]